MSRPSRKKPPLDVLDKLLNPDPPSDVTPAQRQRIRALARRLDAVIPGDGDLEPHERKYLSRWLFLPPLFVILTVRGLRQYPELFAHLPLDVDGLDEGNQRGEELDELGQLLCLLGRRLRDLALRDRSSAIEDAMTLVKYIREQQDDRFVDRELARQQRQALALAEQMLDKRQKRNLKAEKGRKAAAKAGGEGK